MYRRILVGYDGSKAARKAVDTAVQLAVKDGADLHVLAVSRPPEIGDDVETEAIIEGSRRHHRALLAELRGELSRTGVKAHYEVVVGHPAEQIIYHADQYGVDLIVVGDRGRSKIARILLGSISKHVVQYADRPVLVVR
jgi:nucleotide-binding universal stress UspA family protein